MTEIFIKKEKNKKKIALVEDGKLLEYYEEDSEDLRKEGNIYLGIIKDIIPGMQSAFVDIGTEKNSFIHLKDILPKVDETKEKVKTDLIISKIIKPGQKILVQVKKDSNQKKGARVSTHITIPSKYIVLMPNTEIVTISQKIENKDEQERLIKLVKENLDKNNGAIIRTSAEGKEKEIVEDIKRVQNIWNKILKTDIEPKSNKAKLIYKSEDLVEKMLMDLSEKEVEKITVNDEEEKEKLENLINEDNEYKNIKIELKKDEDIFDIYEINKQIEKSQNRKIWLKCGGFITIDKTEALTAIDVNSGKYTGSNNLEQTIFKVNKEATIEIAKQIRLRDTGGIIIIDYIDMENEQDKQKIVELLKEKLKEDRSKTQVEGFTKLDLMEITRKHICSHKD